MVKASIKISGIISDIVENLRIPETLLRIALSSKNPDPLIPNTHHWYAPSLSEGYGGILLLLGNLMRKGSLQEGEEIIHRYMLKLKESIEREGISSLSLFSGASGLAFAIEEASFDGKRYRSMVEALRGFVLDKIEGVYFNPLNKNIEEGRPSPSILFDVIQGVCGIGRYLLENLSIIEVEKKVKDLLKILVKLTLPITVEKKRVPGWILLPEDFLNHFSREPCENGNFNLGLAHGITGVMAFFSIASLRGVEVEGQKDAALRIAHWVMERSFKRDNAIHWSYTISWEEEVGKEPFRMSRSKDAWCYGVPGIARSLFLCAKAYGEERLGSFAKEAFRGIFTRSPQDWELPGPSICHGLAGLLLITEEMSREKGCEEFIPRIEELRELIVQQVIPEAPWRFRDPEISKKGDMVYLDKPSFLEGVSGIVLSLSEVGSRWRLPLLIHA